MSDVQSGLEGVVAFATTIAEPDKEGGALRYRGVDIEDLVGQVPYEQVWGLLVDGSFEPGLAPAQPHPLLVRSGDHRVDVQAALAMLAPEYGYQPVIDITDEQARDDLARASVQALSFVAQSARGLGQPWVPQDEIDGQDSIAGRFLMRWRGEVHPDHVKAIDAYWISAAEHGMNASTFTARVVTSTGADCAAALSSAVGALSGPLHGGANEAALNMLREIGDVKRIPEYIARAKDKDDPFRLMGFGHRVYKNYDPRAKVMQQTAQEVLDELNISDPVLDTARELEQIALKDPYFIEKKLYPNVDFYSGVILNAIGFPTEMFTALFALARTVGWVAQWNEMISDPEQKIGRPRQLYTGEPQRDYVPVEQR